MHRVEFEPRTEDRTRLLASKNLIRTNRNMDKATAFTSSKCWPEGRAKFGTLAWRIMLQCMLKKWVWGYGLNPYGLERRPVPDWVSLQVGNFFSSRAVVNYFRKTLFLSGTKVIKPNSVFCKTNCHRHRHHSSHNNKRSSRRRRSDHPHHHHHHHYLYSECQAI